MRERSAKFLPATWTASGFGAEASAAARRARIVGSPAAEEDAEVHLVLAAIEPAEEAVEAAEVALGDALLDDLQLLRS